MDVLRTATIAVALVGLSACAKPRVNTVEPYLGSAMPRPNQVLVAYFAVTPDQVRLDQGITARIKRATEDQPPDQQAMEAAEDTQVALAEHLVGKLQSYGLPASVGGAPDGPGAALLVQGQIVGIDQGNRTRRTLVGLGAGRSSVTADTQLYYATGAAQPRFMTAFEGTADSGRMPGAAETMGAGAVTERVATSAAVTAGTHAAGETRRSTDTAEAAKLADAIALRIGQFAASQGWIPPDAVK